MLDELVELGSGASFEDLPAAAVEATQTFLLDCLAVGVAGRGGPWRDAVLGDALEALRIMAVLAHPAVPRSCAEVWRRIGLDGDPAEARLPEAARWGQYPAGRGVDVGEPLFPRLAVA